VSCRVGKGSGLSSPGLSCVSGRHGAVEVKVCITPASLFKMIPNNPYSLGSPAAVVSTARRIDSCDYSSRRLKRTYIAQVCLHKWGIEGLTAYALHRFGYFLISRDRATLRETLASCSCPLDSYIKVAHMLVFLHVSRQSPLCTATGANLPRLAECRLSR
jgi:hypothetical protein